MKFRMHYLAISAVGIILLSGCDAAENAANKALEEAKTSAAQIAKDTFSESAEQFSKQIDDAQEATNSWLDGKEPNDQNQEDERAQDDGEADERQPNEA